MKCPNIDCKGELTYEERHFNALADAIERLDVYNMKGLVAGVEFTRNVVSKRHLVVHLGDLFASVNPHFNREKWEKACGAGAEARKVY